MEPEKILSLLAGHDSRKPMPFDELVKASGVDPAELEPILDAMFHRVPALINRAEITKANKTQLMYWPTGVIERFEWKSLSINPKKRPTFPSASRRDEMKPAQPKEENEMPKTKQRREPRWAGKGCGRVFLEYLAEHGTATGQELCALTDKAESVGSYLVGPIKRGHVLVERLGPNARSGNRYTVAPGVTREMLLTDGRSLRAKQAAAEKVSPESGLASAQPPSSEKPSEQSKMPDGVGNSPQAVTGDEGPKGMGKAEESAAQPSLTMQMLIEQLQSRLPKDMSLVIDSTGIDIEWSDAIYTCLPAEVERTIESIEWLGKHQLDSVL
jgi:hypothetical protein